VDGLNWKPAPLGAGIFYGVFMLARMEGRTDVEKVVDTGFQIIERAST